MTDAPRPGQTKTALKRGEERRRAIVAAATTLVARYGSRATSLGEVAATAGVTKSGLLHHFASKDELLEAVLLEHQRVAALVAPAVLSAGGGVASLRALTEILENDARHREQAQLWSLLIAENVDPDSPLHDLIGQRYAGLRAGTEALLRQGQEAGDVRADADVAAIAVEVIAMIRGLETSWLLDPSLPAVDLLAGYLDRLLSALRPR